MVQIFQISVSKQESRKVKYSLNFKDNPLLFDSKKEYDKFKKEFEYCMGYNQRGLQVNYTIRYNGEL